MNSVDAALVGSDRREAITVPSLPDIHQWTRSMLPEKR